MSIIQNEESFLYFFNTIDDKEGRQLLWVASRIHRIHTWINSSMWEAHKENHAEGKYKSREQFHPQAEPFNCCNTAEEWPSKAIKQIEVPLHKSFFLTKASNSSSSSNCLPKKMDYWRFLNADDPNKLPGWSYIVFLQKMKYHLRRWT